MTAGTHTDPKGEGMADTEIFAELKQAVIDQDEDGVLRLSTRPSPAASTPER